MTITLHHVPASPSMRALWLLGEIGLKAEIVRHSGSDPAARVPRLVDGGAVFVEPGAICEHLCEQYDPGLLWRWPGHADRPAWLEWLHFADTLTLTLTLARTPEHLDRVEAALEGRSYLLSAGFSAVDTGIGYALWQGACDLSRHPNVADYVSRIEGRAAFRAACPPPDPHMPGSE
ncbi:MAG: glutathione S-transferase family protein [Pseudomonadota bacterium]